MAGLLAHSLPGFLPISNSETVVCFPVSFLELTAAGTARDFHTIPLQLFIKKKSLPFAVTNIYEGF